MRAVSLLIILFFLLLIHVAAADPDRTYWTDINQYQLSVNDSFYIDDYNITLTNVNEIDPGQFAVHLSIVNATTEDYEIMDVGETLFLSSNRTQFTYLRTDYAKRQVFAAWRLREPSLTFTSVITPIANVSSCDANFTLKNNGDSSAENIVVDLTAPIGANLASTKTLFKNVSVAPSGSIDNSVKIPYSSALVNRSIVARVTYMYDQGKQSGSFAKLLYMPVNNSSVTTEISNTDTSSFTTAPPSVTPVNSTVASAATSTVTPSTGATTTSTPVGAAATTNKTSHKPRVVAFRLHPAPVVTPTPIDVAQTQQDVPAPLTMPSMDFTLTKNDKGILLVCTLFFGWFIIYKL